MLRRNLLSLALAAPLGMDAETQDLRIWAVGDGLSLSPEEYSKTLAAISGRIEPDDYSRQGVVAALETEVARMLGKECAVWMPTGTLANHLAVRALAQRGRRVIVQTESHLLNDCGDCAQTLSGLTLVGLGSGRAGFTLEEAEATANLSLQGRVPVSAGAIQIETPVRRRAGERFDFEEMRKISGWARKQGIGLHLDGARLFLESAYTQRPVSDYAVLFDTVYISMYKYFNAASGAVLAGPKALLAEMYHTRRMFGGGQHQAWPFAAVALHYLKGFEERYRTAVRTSETVIAGLKQDPNFEVERVANGTNIFRLRTPNVNGPTYRGRLEAQGISIGRDSGGWVNVQVNETWNRLPAGEILTRFVRALG